MTPQSELTRLLGIPQELWAEELRGMSDNERFNQFGMSIKHGRATLTLLLIAFNQEKERRISAGEMAGTDRISCDHCEFYHRSPMIGCPWSECPAVVIKGEQAQNDQI